uniref:Uncharacterized protein n=1 Tax=Musa acuminata subsp. malaccensis TaxID=214687 RepID=A0A804KZM2_MUSAM
MPHSSLKNFRDFPTSPIWGRWNAERSRGGCHGSSRWHRRYPTPIGPNRVRTETSGPSSSPRSRIGDWDSKISPS